MKALLTTAAAAMTMAGAARAADVGVTLIGVEPRGGHLLVALQSRGQFMKSDMVAGARLPGASTGEVKLVLGDVRPGDYALTVLHDADDDRTMTFDADGRPAEGWTSPGAEALHARPTFDQVRVHVPAEGVALVLPMIYPQR